MDVNRRKEIYVLDEYAFLHHGSSHYNCHRGCIQKTPSEKNQQLRWLPDGQIYEKPEGLGLCQPVFCQVDAVLRSHLASISAAIMVLVRNESEDVQAMVMVVLCTVRNVERKEKLKSKKRRNLYLLIHR